MGASLMFVCLEGLDGAGKSTQARLLFEQLQQSGVDAELVADPGTTRIGKAIRQILLDNDAPISTAAQMLLFSAARAELSQYIRERLAAGVVVICDRWIMSTLVYQVTLNDVDEDLVMHIFDGTGIQPDLCILLDIDPAAADSRKIHETRKDRYERVDLHEKQKILGAGGNEARSHQTGSALPRAQRALWRKKRLTHRDRTAPRAPRTSPLALQSHSRSKSRDHETRADPS
ncbi:MAG: dTMP kinase [Proteobacteria bacterium]|nr:dTMP kinase [Pseudomonadota bacterium]